MEFAKRIQSAQKPGLHKLSEHTESPEITFKNDVPCDSTSASSSTRKDELHVLQSLKQELT